MEIAALILSVIALVVSIANLVIMLAKNFFSSHTVQYVDPFKDSVPSEIGKPILDAFRDLDAALSQDEIDEIKGRKAKF
jgi:hypothetical protein